MATILWGALSLLESVYADGQTGRIAVLAVLVLGGMALYFALALLFRAAALGDIKSLLARKKADDTASSA
jgi:hypothetical protein